MQHTNVYINIGKDCINMSIPNRKRNIHNKLRLLREEIKRLEEELKQLYKKDHRTSQCKHSINEVCYACSYP